MLTFYLWKENKVKKSQFEIHCFFSNVFGVLLLAYAGISCVFVFYRLLFHENSDYTGMLRTLSLLINMMLLGLLLLGTSQFLQYVSGQTDKKGWVLHRGKFIIYFAIFLTIVQAIWGFSIMGTVCSGGSCSLATGSQKYIWNIIFGGTLVFVKILILYGVAQSLQMITQSSSKKEVDSD